MEPAKLGKIIEDITAPYRDGVGISIMADEDTFKSTYQILLELSEVWGDLKDTEKSYLLEKISGKHRATQISAILSNGKTLAEAYITAMEASGSAQEEFEKRTKSVEYHLAQLSAAWQELSVSAASTETVNSIIDSIRGLVEFINKIGVDNTAITAVGSIVGILLKFKAAPFLEGIGEKAIVDSEKISFFGKELTDLSKKGPKVAGAMKLATTAIKGLSVAISGAVAIYGLTFVFDLVTSAVDKYVNRIEHMKEEIEEISGNIEDLNSEMSVLQAKETLGTLTQKEKERLDVLKEEIALQEADLKLSNQRLAAEYAKEYEPQNTYVDPETDMPIYVPEGTDGTESAIEEFTKKTNELTDSYLDASIAVNKLYDKTAQLQEELESLPKNTDEYNKKLLEMSSISKELSDAKSKLTDAESSSLEQYEFLIEERNKLNHIVEHGTELEKEAAEENLKTVESNIEMQKALLGLDDASKEFAEEQLVLIDNYDYIQSVTASLTSENGLAAKELDNLREKYPELADIVEEYGVVSNGAYTISQTGLENLQTASNNAFSGMMNEQLFATKIAQQEAEKRLKKYQAEATALEALWAQNATAKQDALDKLNDGKFELGDIGAAATVVGSKVYEIINGGYREKVKNELAQAEQDAKDAAEASRIIEEALKAVRDNSGGTDPNANKNGKKGRLSNPGSGSGSKKSADIWDKYAHALAKANDEIERYNKVVEITQGKLDLNQSTENRTVELLAEEVQLYDELIASTKAKYKVVNDTLWAQQQGLQKMYTEAAKYMGLDADAVANMTDADLEAYIELKLDEDKANDQKIAHLLNGIIDMRENVHGLHLDWLDMKAEIKELEREEINIRINLQADLEEKFDASREGAKKVLDILEEMEGTETQRAEILGQMAESYESEINSNMQLYAENSERLLEMAKAGNTESDEYNDLLEHANEIQLRNLDLIKEQLDTRLKQIEAEKELAVRQLETQVYGEQGQDAWEKSRENEIDRLQNQLDALDEDTSEADYLEELEEKEETIRKLEEKLANLQRERTVKQLKQEEDGSWQWEYVVDDRAIAETQAELDDARADLQKTKDNKALEDQKDAIQNRIDAIEQEIEDKNDYYTMEMERLEEHYAKKKELEEQAAQDQIDTLNKQTQDVVNALNKLEQKTGDGLDEVARETDKGMETIADTYSAWCTTIKTQISSWVEEVIREFNRLEDARRAAQEEAASMAPSVASVDGSHANGLKFVESNNYIARLHYGERVLTRQEAAQYNELEEDIKSGKLEAYFNSLREDTVMSFSDAATASVMRTTSMPTTNSNTTSFVIEHLELPEVKDPTDFAMVIDNWARGEFGGMAQRARIVKAK